VVLHNQDIGPGPMSHHGLWLGDLGIQDDPLPLVANRGKLVRYYLLADGAETWDCS
jgi:hypothetical protein